jgi:hypothetical protein
MTQVTWKHATGGDFALDTATLPPKALDYLILNGFRQSMADSIAGKEKAIKDMDAAKFAKALDDAKLAPDTTREAYAKRVVAETLAERFKDICDGTVGTRAQGSKLSIPRGDEVAKKMRQYAEEAADAGIAASVAKAKAEGRILVAPTGEKLLAIVKAYYDKHENAYRKRAEKEIAAANAAAADIDIESMLG